jgi:hypothetical protein
MRGKYIYRPPQIQNMVKLLRDPMVEESPLVPFDLYGLAVYQGRSALITFARKAQGIFFLRDGIVRSRELSSSILEIRLFAC